MFVRGGPVNGLVSIRTSVNKGVPYGNDRWVDAMITKYHLETTKRGAGRPKKVL